MKPEPFDNCPSCPVIIASFCSILLIIAMASSENILRIRRSDNDSDFVLLNVSNNGPSPLDLRLLATEGENPYATDSESRILFNPS